MPQATEELRKRWNGPSDHDALDHLLERGYCLTDDFQWAVPARITPSEDDVSAVQFLQQEWDYGGFVYTTRSRSERITRALLWFALIFGLLNLFQVL